MVDWENLDRMEQDRRDQREQNHHDQAEILKGAATGYALGWLYQNRSRFRAGYQDQDHPGQQPPTVYGYPQPQRRTPRQDLTRLLFAAGIFLFAVYLLVTFIAA